MENYTKNLIYKLIIELENQKVINQNTLTLALTSAKLESEIQKYEIIKQLNTRILELELELIELKKNIRELVK